MDAKILVSKNNDCGDECGVKFFFASFVVGHNKFEEPPTIPTIFSLESIVPQNVLFQKKLNTSEDITTHQS